jgi:hypothetical protein
MILIRTWRIIALFADLIRKPSKKLPEIKKGSFSISNKSITYGTTCFTFPI